MKEGDLVMPVSQRDCGECRDCKSRRSFICSKFDKVPNMPRDGTSRFRDVKGDVVHNFLSLSTFTQYTVVDITHIFKITADIPVDKACLLSGVSTGECEWI